jgi:hypothetical protein
MTSVCPCCRRALPSLEELIAEKAAKLRERCASLSIEIVADEDGEFVHERDAATLLNIQRQTLRKRRYGARPIAFRKSGASPEYSLRSIAIDKLETAEVSESDVQGESDL